MADGEEKEETEHSRVDPRVALIQSYTLKAFKVVYFAGYCLVSYFASQLELATLIHLAVTVLN